MAKFAIKEDHSVNSLAEELDGMWEGNYSRVPREVMRALN